MRAFGWICASMVVLFGCEKTGAAGGAGSGGTQLSDAGTPPAPDAGPTPPPPAQQHALHLSVTGDGEVRASTFACRTDCQQMLDAAATVQLTAVPDAGWRFDGWQGACSGAAGCSVAMSADHDVGAIFTAIPPPPPRGDARIEVVLVGSGSGRITSTPSGIDCPGACSETVQSGTSVSLAAQADASSSFTGWGGGCSGSGGCSVTASADVVVWANFTASAPPPPPPPPAQCAGLTPARPGPARSIANSTSDTCGTGMADTTGTLGLESFQSTPPGDFLHIVDSATGFQRAVTNYGGYQGSFAPTRDGFIGVFHYSYNSNPVWTAQYWNHAGNFVQYGQAIQGKPIVTGSPSGAVLMAGDFNWQGQAAQHILMVLGPNSTNLRCGASLNSPGAVFGLGADASDRTLVVTDGGGGNIDAQWFSDACAPMTGAFRLISGFQAGRNTWFETAPLIGGGVAVRRVDQQNDPAGRAYRTAQWLLVITPGSATPQAAPKWLADRPGTNLAIALSGRAYAMLPMGAPDADCAQRIEVVAADGTGCGFFDSAIASGKCRTLDVGLGMDGTPVQVLPSNLGAPSTCSYRWWPQALR